MGKPGSQDLHFMRRCLELAVLGRPSPNPFVGAVIVCQGRIIGEGYHKAAGQKHAEVEAIEAVRRQYGAQAKMLLANSTLYVNLEPCNHYGKQPPCTKAIINADIPRVVYSMKDTNQRVKGNGEKELRKAGVAVTSGVLERQAQAINAPFIHHMHTNRAYVTLKMAMSRDGKMATESKRNRFISSPASRKLVHLMRDKAPAIMAGIGTIKADNPKLTCRIKNGHNPLRIIIDQHLEIDESARVLHDKNVLIVCAKPKSEKQREKLARLQTKGAGVFRAKERKDKFLDLKPLLEHMTRIGFDHILLEGGPGLAQDMLEHGLVDEIVLFRSQKRVGKTTPRPEMTKAVRRIQSAAKNGLARIYRPKSGPDSIQISVVNRQDGRTGGQCSGQDSRTGRQRKPDTDRHSFWTEFFAE